MRPSTCCTVRRRLSDFEPALILAFLYDLEQQRHNCVRSRNLRLMALRAFLKFAARRDITALHILKQALGVPSKRSERPMLGFLSHEEMLAVIGEPGSMPRRYSCCAPAVRYCQHSRSNLHTEAPTSTKGA
ncbi:hypothetical protein SAMN05421783_113163 [Thiocapsa roseopersicina]|uniref:Phage integrase, N-terminal SAM-like domain n=1 Tax=Thiocapsa roseopersicina TaxID=1058 RepID=A0A1H2YT71_THIRO|nr:hypothetical protein SAMN05421783_113163 [Thiocapsa roseopersicina]